MKYIIFACVGLGGVLLYLLSRASANTALFSENYPLLLGLNIAVAVCLALLIFFQLRVLRRKLRARVFGAKLTLRLVMLFALMAVLPGVLVYGVSVRFLTKSIESWFNVQVDNALEGGLSLGRSALDHLLRDVNKKAEAMAVALADQPESQHLTLLNSLREQTGVQEATLFSYRGTILAYSSSDAVSLLPDRPSASVLRQVRMQQPYGSIDSIPGKGLYLRVVVPVNVLSLSEDIRVLQLLQPVPRQLAKDAEMVQTVYRDYQQLSLAREGLKQIYSLTLTLTLLLAMFSAIALAFVISARLSAPLGILAKGTRNVAKGDFSEMPELQSRDELGQLMQSFNSMTRQLAEARAAAEFNQQQMEEARAYLESILANLSSGVLAFDDNFVLRAANTAASQILGQDLVPLTGRAVTRWESIDPGLGAFGGAICDHFGASGEREWQRQHEYGGGPARQVLLVRGSRLPAGLHSGYVVVFDDVTHLLQAQRDAAWGEVARRLAHEIKNPLTPIQLSAERLELKLADKLATADADVLKRATATIVNQVTALKHMVDDFSEYARSPRLSLESLDLNRLVREVLALYENPGPTIDVHLDARLPRVLGDTTLMRQVIHNLMQNAQDAVGGQPDGRIEVTTERVDNGARLVIRDNGAGFAEHILPRAFEPYVTTKPKGTGLGLAIVKKIVEEHSGTLQVENGKPGGACVSVVLPAAPATVADGIEKGEVTR